MKNQKLKIWILVCGFAVWSLNFAFHSFAQEDNKLVTLSKQVMEAKSSEGACLALEELKDLYFGEHKYNDFVDFLNSLIKQKKELEPAVNYYIGLARYHQLKYLEEAQDWDEYFSLGNSYRDQITSSLQKTIDSLASSDALSIYARLILWKFHRDQQDTFAEGALSGLMSSLLAYAPDAKNPLPIKDVAKELLSYGERGKAKELYKIYVAKIAATEIKDSGLSDTALGFYKEGNLELAESVYDVYIERIAKSLSKEKLAQILIDIAKLFTYQDEKPSDAPYAEKIFQKIEEIGAKVFNEELLYLRAFNLEKAKEYQRAKDIYLGLIQGYPQTPHADEALFKTGIIYTYILGDVASGRAYFEKLAQKETLSPHTISSLYQLGLLSQWEADTGKAKEYYNRLIEKAKEGFLETVTLAQERLKEIEEEKPIAYNLKTFLDASLKETFDMSKVNLKASIYRLKEGQEDTITSDTYMPQSGCMQVEVQYLWSGHLGTASPSLEVASFETSYTYPGTKELNLVVVSPSGILDRSIDLVDVN